MLVGPRASGKTTTALRHARSTVRLDLPAQAAAFQADPDAALRSLAEPVLLDEWQLVPGVLGAVKRAVDTDPRAGRFIITGSVRADLDADGWPATGRVVRVPMTGVTRREIDGAVDRETFLERLVRDGAGSLRELASPWDLRDYIEHSVRSTFPEPVLRLSAAREERWTDSYLEQLLVRDVAQLAGAPRDPDRMHRYFEAYAVNSAGIVDTKRLFEVAEISRAAADAYEQILRNLFIVEATPAWSTNRLKRLTRRPKRYVLDPGLVAAALQVDADGVMRDGDLMGRMLDTFVAAQLRAERPLGRVRSRWYHLRREHGEHEIDLLAELGRGRVVAMEIKASSAPDKRSARHLAWLRDELDQQFVIGVVLHTGSRVYELGDRIVAAPISSIWA